MAADAKTREIILRIAKKIGENYKPERIILYGSFAYGNPGRDSDIDLLIIKDTNERPADRCLKVRQIMAIDEGCLDFPSGNYSGGSGVSLSQRRPVFAADYIYGRGVVWLKNLSIQKIGF